MPLNRRRFIALTGSLPLAACAPGAPRSQTSTPAVAPEFQPRANAAFSSWVAQFRPRASAAGISSATFDAAFANAGLIPGVIDRDRNQIQNRRTLEDYLAITASEERITKGRAAYRQNRATLDAIEARYGVDGRLITAIWGVESFYGERRGTIPVISSTATLAFEGRRGQFYEAQLIAALKILQRGDIAPDRMTGSWAGAMGHTQFIPTSFEGFAVDFTGDGRRDIWGNDPSDALASAASYLSRNGWQNGLPWGAEEGASNLTGRTLQPQAGGIRFTVTRNFNVIKTYNNSDFYAIGVGHLADRIGGAGPFQGQFPPDANGLSQADRMTIQRGLTQRGYDVGGIDGVIGGQSEAAIRDFQQRQGLPVTGIATRDVLIALQ